MLHVCVRMYGTSLCVSQEKFNKWFKNRFCYLICQAEADSNWKKYVSKWISALFSNLPCVSPHWTVLVYNYWKPVGQTVVEGSNQCKLKLKMNVFVFYFRETTASLSILHQYKTWCRAAWNISLHIHLLKEREMSFCYYCDPFSIFSPHVISP